MLMSAGRPSGEQDRGSGSSCSSLTAVPNGPLVKGSRVTVSLLDLRPWLPALDVSKILSTFLLTFEWVL